MGHSSKADRQFQLWRIAERWERGEDPVVIGAIYELRKSPGMYVALAFRKENAVWKVGIARGGPLRWEFAEAEAYSLRTLGYYERWLKRHGIFTGYLNRRGDAIVPFRENTSRF